MTIRAAPSPTIAPPGPAGAPSFVLYRILGNDLPPMHRPGQTVENLRFILRHEPPLPGCEKRWVVNRIVDRRAERTVLDLIQAAGHGLIHLPFDWAAYARQRLVIDGVRADRYFHTPGFLALRPVYRALLTAACLGERNRYAMNNNGARNAALGEGRALADWVLPWDGNCFVSAESWRAIVDAARSGEARYLIVPMTRLDDNGAALDPTFAPTTFDEPQIAFGPGSVEVFDETLAYGASPKAALLVRLGVPGEWEQWAPARRAADTLGPSPDAGSHRMVGWVSRLAGGIGDTRDDARARYRRRLEASNRFLQRLDAATLQRQRATTIAMLYAPVEIERLRARWRLGEMLAIMQVIALRRVSRESLLRRIPTIADRPGTSPSDDPRDFWTASASRPASPDLAQDDDAIRLHLASFNAVTLTLAARIIGERQYARHGAAIVRSWLIDPATRMSPHLRYAATGGGGEGTAAGVVEGRGIVPMIEAARLLLDAGALDADDMKAIDAWVEALREWLRTSEQGQAARIDDGMIGTGHDLLALACDLHLGRMPAVAECLDGVVMRIAGQIRPDGHQAEASGRIRPGLDALRNLEIWTTIARLADGLGRDIRGPVRADGRSLATAASRLLMRAAPPDRMPAASHPLRTRLAAVHTLLATPVADAAGRLDFNAFSPAAGLLPYWSVGLLPRPTAGAAEGSHGTGDQLSKAPVPGPEPAAAESEGIEDRMMS